MCSPTRRRKRDSPSSHLVTNWLSLCAAWANTHLDPTGKLEVLISLHFSLSSKPGGREGEREEGKEGVVNVPGNSAMVDSLSIVRSSRKGSARGERGGQRGGGAEQAAEVPNRCKVRRRQRPPPISIPQHLATLVSGERVRVEFIATGREKRTPFDGTSLTS